MFSRRQVVALIAGAPLATPMRSLAQATPTMQSLPILVDPAWLQASGNDVSLVAFMSEKEAAPGVITSSTLLDWPELEVTDTTPEGLNAWTEAMTHVLAAHSLGTMKTTVVYDAGSLFAARAWWVARALGSRDIAILDGGLDAWRAAGQAAESEPVAYETSGTGSLQLDLAMIAPIADVEAAIGTPDVTFIDARAPEEYAKGHLPGALNINYPRNARAEAPHTFLPQIELETLYQDVPKDQTVIPYCSSGVRSAVTAVALRLAGYERVRLFTGSWNEWSQDPERPVTTGDAP